MCIQPICASAQEDAKENEKDPGEAIVTQEASFDADKTTTSNEDDISGRELDKGDVNGDKKIDIEDAVRIINYINGVRPMYKNQLDAADLDGSNGVDIQDAVILINYINGVSDISGNSTIPEVRSRRFSFKTVKQDPELPTGGEVAVLTAVLNSYGYSVDKVTISRQYLPKQGFEYKDGKKYGPDFKTTFAGDPESSDAYGCYAPCIVTAANNYLADKGASNRAKEVTGTEFEKLLSKYTAKDIPVIIWTTSGLIDPKPTDKWYTSDGKEVQWLANENSVVITGFDLDKKLVYLSDPISGDVVYDLDRVKKRYDQMGKQAVVLEKGKPVGGQVEQPDDNKDSGSKNIDVQVVLQNPELPTGGEVTALAIALNHVGFSIDKVTLARTYLPKMDFYTKNGMNYGADFNTTFAGDPENEYSYGCFAPCIEVAGNNYLKTQNTSYKAKNLTGNDFDKLLTDYTDKDKLVMIWITSNLSKPVYEDSWYSPNGTVMKWPKYASCIVLTGYDKSKKLVYAVDPNRGKVSLDMDLVRERYNDLGKNSVIIDK